MVIKQWTKLLVCVMVISCTTLLMMTDKVEMSAGVALISGVMGYVFGNGHAIVEKKTPVEKINQIGG